MTDKLELKSCHEVVYTVDVADVDSIFYCKPTDPDILTVLMKDGKRLYCDEVCPIDSLQEEPVSNPIDFEKELYKAFGQVKDFTLGMQIAKWFYDMGKNSQEPVSEDLKEASKNYALNNTPWDDCKDEIQESFRVGAKWQKTNLWKHADGDELPEYEREVVVLHQPYPLEGSEYAVSFAHRPDPKGWDGTNIVTGKVEHYTPKTYDKGGWNSPDIKWWLDLELPCGGRTISMNYTDKNKEIAK